MCKTHLDTGVFERNIKVEKQRDIFKNIAIFKSFELGENERWVHCKKCNYGEVRKANSTPLFVFCKKEGCKKITCNICYEEVSKADIEEYENNEEMEELDNEIETDNLIGKHLKYCATIGKNKLELEQIISEANTQVCPNCGTRGRKDNNCTHMTCLTCSENWCYCCGLSLVKCDKASGKNGFQGHNED